MNDRAAAVWAACFVALGALALLVELEVWRPRAGWMWPVLLMATGVVLLVAGVVGGASRHDDERRGR